jgi:hypothetical protein
MVRVTRTGYKDKQGTPPHQLLRKSERQPPRCDDIRSLDSSMSPLLFV